MEGVLTRSGSKITQTIVIQALGAMVGTTYKILKENTATEELMKKFRDIELFFTKAQKCTGREPIQIDDESLLVELLCRADHFSEADATKISGILNLIKNKKNESYYISIPRSLADARTKIAFDAMVLTAEVAIGAHGTIDVIESATTAMTGKMTGKEKTAFKNSLKEYIGETLVAGFSAKKALEAAQSSYKLFTGKLDANYKSNLSILFRHLLFKDDKKVEDVLRAFVTRQWTRECMQPTDINLLFSAVREISSMVGSEEVPAEQVQAAVKLLSKLNLFPIASYFLEATGRKIAEGLVNTVEQLKKLKNVTRRNLDKIVLRKSSRVALAAQEK